jgi:hypothetical protein
MIFYPFNSQYHSMEYGQCHDKSRQGLALRGFLPIPGTPSQWMNVKTGNDALSGAEPTGREIEGALSSYPALYGNAV